jgi:hypothetical protein
MLIFVKCKIIDLEASFKVITYQLTLL